MISASSFFFIFLLIFPSFALEVRAKREGARGGRGGEGGRGGGQNLKPLHFFFIFLFVLFFIFLFVFSSFVPAFVSSIFLQVLLPQIFIVYSFRFPFP